MIEKIDFENIKFLTKNSLEDRWPFGKVKEIFFLFNYNTITDSIQIICNQRKSYNMLGVVSQAKISTHYSQEL